MDSSPHSHPALSCAELESVGSYPVLAGRPHPSPKSVRMRQASLDDYPQIVELQSKYGLETKSYEEWRHLWFNNPAYLEYQEQLPIGWVLEQDSKSIVGYLGNIPLFYELEGQRLLASVAHAWVAEVQYRSYSPLLLERYFSQTVVDLFLNATVGSLAARSFASFQSLPVPAGDWDRSSFWITNYQGFAANWLAMKAFPLAEPLSYLLSVGLFVRDEAAKTRLRHHSGVEVEGCTSVDGRFDSFWEALKTINSHILMGVRTREALEWHFQYALKQNKAWIVTARKGSNLTAYGIFRRYDNPTFGLQRMRLVDFKALDDNADSLIPMLHWALESCRREGIDMVECIGFGANKAEVIRKMAPHARKLPSWLYFYKAKEKRLAEKLSDPNVWDPSQFDGDASL
jgi:hypothetical protein